MAGSPPQTQASYLLGRVLLDGPVAGVRVEIVDLSGRVVHSFTTNDRGWFQKRGTVPADFSVLAYVGEDVYRREVRGGWPRGTLYVSTGTALLGAYAAAHPGLSLDDAQERLRTALKLPADFKMSWIGQVRTTSFSEAEFLEGVRQEGSLDRYLESRVAALDQTIAAQLVETAFDKAGQLVGSCISSIWGAAVTDAAGDAVANCGFNYTTAGALSNVSSQLQAVESELSGLETQLQGVYNDVKLSAQLAPLKSAAGTIATASSDLQGTIDAYQRSHPEASDYDVPQEANPDIETARTNLLGLNIQEVARPITELSQGQIQSSFFAARASSGTSNFPDKSLWLGYPWRNNATTRDAQALLSQNWGRLAGASYLLSETAHASGPSQRATQVSGALTQLDRWAADVQTGNFYVPDLLQADDLYLDASTGLLWANEFFSPLKIGDAKAAVANLTYGPVGETTPFSIPFYEDVDYLCRNRAGVQIPSIADQAIAFESWPNVDTSEWTGAFNALGIDTKLYHNVDNAGIGGSDDKEGVWIQDNKPTVSSETYNFYTWNKAKTNPHDDSFTSTETSSYLACVAVYSVPDTSPNGQDPAQVALATTAEVSPWSYGITGVPPVVSQGQTTAFGGVQMHAGLVFTEYGNYQYNSGKSYDVTNRLVWSTSNPSLATISNLSSATVPAPLPTQLAPLNGDGSDNPPPPAGLLVWHPPIFASDPLLGPVTVTAKALTCDGLGNVQTTSGQMTVQPPAGLTAKIASVNFQPRNTQYVVSNSTAAPIIDFYVTAYFQDGRIVDLSQDPNTTWQLLDSDQKEISSSTEGGFGVAKNSKKNQLVLYPGLNDLNPIVQVKYSSTFGKAVDKGQISVIVD